MNHIVICQLSKLLKSKVHFHHFLRILVVKSPNHVRFIEVVWILYPKMLKEWWAIPGSNQ